MPASGSSTPTCSTPGLAEVPEMLAPPDDAGAAGQAGSAHVGVEVGEVVLVEEDRVGERSVPRGEAGRPPVGIAHGDGHQCGLGDVEFGQGFAW